MKENNRVVAVIGNSIISEILASLLSKEWHLIKITDENQRPVLYPYYPNDVKTGIMGHFLNESGLMNGISTEKRVKEVSVYLEEKEYLFPCSFEGFQNSLEKYFPEDKEAIHQMFSIFKIIGDEWANYIGHNFEDGMKIFKETGKYSSKTMKDIEDVFQVHTKEVNKILNVILPVEDETLAVYGGYLYTQFFDIHSCSEDALEYICKVGSDKLEQLQVNNLTKISIEGMLPDQRAHIPVDVVIDCRIATGMEGGADYNSGCGSFQICIEDLSLGTVVYLKTEDIWLHIWNRQILNQVSDNIWDFEFCFFKEPISDVELKHCIMSRLKISISYFRIYESEYFKNQFDVNESEAFRWAFNKKVSATDPMNLVRKQRNPIVICNQWGFAWFSAAYHIRNVLNNQVIIPDNHLYIVNHEDFMKEEWR